MTEEGEEQAAAQEESPPPPTEDLLGVLHKPQLEQAAAKLEKLREIQDRLFSRINGARLQFSNLPSMGHVMQVLEQVPAYTQRAHALAKETHQLKKRTDKMRRRAEAVCQKRQKKDMDAAMQRDRQRQSEKFLEEQVDPTTLDLPTLSNKRK